MRRIISIEDKPSDLPEKMPVIPVTFDELIDKTREILRREITNLMILSAKGPLDRDSAMSLVQYIKLLGELKAKEDEELQKLGDAHLARLAKGDKS